MHAFNVDVCAAVVFFHKKLYAAFMRNDIFNGRVDAFVYKRKYNNAYTFHVAGTDDESF